MRLDRQWIESHIPHRGRMCLWDEVVRWDTARVSCRGDSHRDPDHPLLAHGRVGIACGAEYAVQAMAIHGALLAREAGSAAPAAGFVVSMRDVQPRVLRLDDIPGDLQCEVTRLAGNDGTALYAFELHSATQCLLRGRATVVIDATGLLPP